MNAFKKELAGILLSDNQTERAVENLVYELDEVFSNLSRQVSPQDDSFCVWQMFISRFAGLIIGKIDSSCFSDDDVPFDGAKELMLLLKHIQAYTKMPYDEMMDVSEQFLEYYKNIKL